MHMHQLEIIDCSFCQWQNSIRNFSAPFALTPWFFSLAPPKTRTRALALHRFQLTLRFSNDAVLSLSAQCHCRSWNPRALAIETGSCDFPRLWLKGLRSRRTGDLVEVSCAQFSLQNAHFPYPRWMLVQTLCFLHWVYSSLDSPLVTQFLTSHPFVWNSFTFDALTIQSENSRRKFLQSAADHFATAHLDWFVIFLPSAFFPLLLILLVSCFSCSIAHNHSAD